MVAEADQALQRSIDAAARGGFTAMTVNLRGAQDQLHEVQRMLATAKTQLAAAAGPVASAPKEIDAAQIVALLAPLTSQLETISTTTRGAASKIPPVVQRIAASANRSTALG